MADEAKFTQADLDAAIEKAVGPMRSKLDEVMDEAKEAKRKLRAASEINPADLTAAEERAEKAERALADATKQIKTLTTERDTAAKALEAEQGAARSAWTEAEITDAIAKGGVVPALIPALKAMVAQQAKADLVDGRYAVSIGDKPARDYIAAFLDSDDGKAFKAAPANGGGGATGGSGNSGGKSVSSEAFYAMDAKSRAAFLTGGGAIADAA